MPRVILVSDLHNYYRNENSDEMTRLAHMLCACLSDAISYCSRVYNATSYLIISSQDTALETQKLSIMYFSSSTWISTLDNDQVIFCKKKLYSHQQQNYKIKFFKLNDKLRCDSVEILYL